MESEEEVKKDAVAQEDKKPENETTGTADQAQTLDISTLNEDDLYEKVNLYGTLVKVVKYPKSSTMADLSSHNTYMVYDHCHKKFYIMLLASSHRYIAVAEDLHEMYSLLKEHSSK